MGAAAWPAGGRGQVSARLYLIVGLILAAIPLGGYGVIRWIDRHREWAEECFRKPVRTLVVAEEDILVAVRQPVIFAPDGRHVIFGGPDGSIRLWEIDSGGAARELGRYPGRVTALALLPDGRHLLSAGEGLESEEEGREGSLRLWDWRAGREVVGVFPFRLNLNCRVTALAVAPGGRRALCVVEACLLFWLDLAAGEAGPFFSGPSGSYESRPVLAFPADGERFLLSDNYSLRSGDVGGQASREIRSFLPPKSRGGEPPLSATAFSPDGTRLCCCGYRGSGRATELLDLATGRSVPLASRRQTSAVWWQCTAFSADGRRVVTGGTDADSVRVWTVIALWEAETGRLIGEFRRPPEPDEMGCDVVKLAVAPDDRHLLAVVLVQVANAERTALVFHRELLLWRLPDELGYRLLGTEKGDGSGGRAGP